MDVNDALARRRMVRSFDASPLDPALIARLFEEALQVPTAGNCRGVEWVTLCGREETSIYFDTTTDASWRERSARFAGLARASAIGVCVANPDAYLERYSAPDKESSGLGWHPEDWPVPYWFGDAGASTLAALLLAEAEGLAAAFLGAFRGEDSLIEALRVPRSSRIYGAVLLGRPDGNDHRSPSLDRPGPSRGDRVHRRTYRGQG